MMKCPHRHSNDNKYIWNDCCPSSQRLLAISQSDNLKISDFFQVCVCVCGGGRFHACMSVHVFWKCVTYPFANSWIFRKGSNGFHIFVCQSINGHLVIFLGYVISLNNSGKHWESICCVQRTIIVVVICSCQFLDLNK